MPPRAKRNAVPRTELLRPFAASIFAKTEALRRLELTRSERARLREAVADDIKKCTNFCTPTLSRRAARKAHALGVDLRIFGWHQQPRFDPGRKIFHWEHQYTVRALREECLRQRSPIGILRILRTKARIVWILKSEDRQLTKLGYRSHRDDPAKA